MVERTVCSTGEETNTSRSLKNPSCSIDTSIDRNDDFRATENVSRREKLENCEILTVPEVEKSIEGGSSETSRESAIGGIATGTGRFSLFKWFKRGSRESASSSSSSLCDRREGRKRSNKEEKARREAEELDEDEIASELSSNESVETLYSTATVRSFAFCTGTLRNNEDETRGNFSTTASSDIVKNATRQVGPFGSGAAKIATRFNANDTDVTKTLPANVLSKRRDITARYSLQPCNGNTGAFISCGNIAIQRENLGGTLRRHEGRGGRVHVRGKRRAPNPPVSATKSKNIDGEAKISKNTGRRKRRPAPKPPDTNIARLKVTTSLTTRKQETESVNFAENKETESAGVASNEEVKSASVNLSTKGEGATLSGEEETGSVVLPEKKFINESEKGVEVVEVRGEEKVDARISVDQRLVSNPPVVSENNPTPSENLPETVRETTVKTDVTSCPSNEGQLERASREGVNSGNSDLFSSRKTVGDVTNFNTGTLVNASGTNVSSKSEVLDLPGSISNDSLVLQGGVLHSKREIVSCSTSSPTSISTTDLERTLGTSKGRFPVTTGSQTSASAMPRPWYKRSVFEHSRESGTSRRAGDVLRNPTQPEVHEERVVGGSVSGSSSSSKSRQGEKSQEGGTLSRLNFFHRSEKNSEERKKENKRKSGLSILTNISELDKEAAAIVQEEQARARAASMILQASRSSEQTTRNEGTEDVVQDMVTSAIESSPRRGTRALISKFNAIGNITKVTVNTSFLAKNAYSGDAAVGKTDTTKNSSEESRQWRGRPTFSKSENVRVDKDLSRYFLPAQRQTTSNKTMDDIVEIPRDNSTSKQSKSDISARLSFFQGIAGDKRDNSGDREASLQAKISRLNEEVLVRDAGKSSQETSPNVSKIRVNILETISPADKSYCQGFNEKTKKTGVKEEANKEMHTEKKDRDIIRKDFSSIFNEIERQGTSRDFGNRTTNAKKFETSSSTSQVSKVLDLLVEAEKNDKQKTNLSRYSRGNENLENLDKQNDTPTSLVENPAKTDLKEMLKEMKHSLPKRSKAKKLSSHQSSVKTEGDVSMEGEKGEFNLSEDKQKDTVTLADKKNIISHLLSPVTVAYPPPIRIGPPANRVEKTIFRANEEREYDKQKVSSAAQTSGNVRKVSRQGQGKTDDETQLLGHATSSKWKNEDVVYRTSGKAIGVPGTSGLTKNTFQLIRPREFAQIEAIKTMKNSRAENTYANVIEHSLYANAVVPATKTNSPQVSRIEETREKRTDLVDDQKSRIREAEITESGIMAQDAKVVDQQNMNTLAVNRLLRKLEAAIASGHHQQAAGLAKELARLKIHCSVVRQRTKTKDIVNVNMYIEDKLAHQGPIPLRLARSMTVAQLKAKVFTEFEIPTNVQRWIVGQRLADDDATTLESLQTIEGSTVFLYLVAPELKNDDSPSTVEKVPSTEQEPPRDPDPQPVEEEIMILDPVEESDEEPAKEPTESEIIKDEDDEECISEEVRMERYEALISLENCDIIPNSEHIECPICLVTYGPQEGVILRDCLHMFCRPCLANTIRYCEEAEVRCPYRDTEYTCESTLQEREIKALVEPVVYQRHLAKSISQAENNAGNNAFHCKTPDCPGWCIYDDNVNNFLCPVCGVSNCLTCQVVHTGMNCREYQKALRLSKETDQESKRTAAMLEEMVDKGEALPCPTCAVVLMKKWGCDWLRCSMCRTEICWITKGPRWGPGGKGDTSGGCRCGENGVKCHPRCNYCH